MLHPDPETQPCAAVNTVQRLFMVGAPRSGTTLAQTMVAAHPQVVSLFETHFFAHLHPVPRRYGARRPVRDAWRSIRAASERKTGLTGRSRHIRRRLRVQLEDLGLTVLAPRIPKSLRVDAYARFFIEALDAYAAANDRSHWLYKTTTQAPIIERLERLVPDARFLHVVRSGENVVASIHDANRRIPESAGWGKFDSLDACIDTWNENIDAARAVAGRPNHHVVRYEDLVADPEATLRDLCAFAGLPFDRAMIEDRSAAARNLDIAEKSREGIVHERVVSLGIHQNLGKFERLFDAPTQAYINARLRPLDRPLALRAVHSA